MEEAGTLRRGSVITMDGNLFVVVKTEFRNPGNWRAFVQVTLKNLRTGTMAEQRFRPQDKVQVAFTDRREAEYVYSDANSHNFMYTDTYEQEPLPREILGDDALYLHAGDKVEVLLCDNKPVSVEMPKSVKHKISETQPSLRGSTAQAQYKPAVTETGLRIQVPPFIEIGDVVEIDTRTGEYLSRVSG